MKLTDQFRPKADRAALHQLNDAAWQEVSGSILERIVKPVGEAVLAHLEAMYPPADMEFLARYKCTMECKQAHIRIRMPKSDRWDESVSIDLPRPVTVATSYSGLYAGGPRWSEGEDHYGLSDATIAQIKAGEHDLFESWDAYLASHREREGRQAPRSCDALLFELIAARQAYKREYRQLSDWPAQFKAEHGVYPSWQQIAEQFPVVGKRILAMRQSQAA